jgi:twitching motility two-component system response regulator PilG
MISPTASEMKRVAVTTGLALRQGVVAAQAQDFDRARPFLQQATSEAPDDLVGWYWLAIASASPDSAMACLRRVLAIDAGHAPARDALAKLLITEARHAAGRSDSTTARTLATEASQLTPSSPAPWLALAALAGTHVDRIEALRHLVALAPDDTRLRTQLRQALFARGVMIASSDRVEARDRFREAADLNPSDPRVWQALSQLAESRAEAMELLRELLKVAPDHLQGRTSLRDALGAEARAVTAEGYFDQACALWREAITVNGGDAESWLGLAETTSDEGEAAAAIETAYELNPDHPEAKAAMDRLRGERIDLSAITPLEDPFARFELAADALPAFTLDEHLIDTSESLLDAFAQLEEAAVARPPVATPEEVQPAAPIEATPTAADGEARRTVMVVDDSPTIRKILGLTLERAGYAVVAEADGEAALARLAQLTPDVILLDISMPKLDGYEVCKRIKQDARTTNVPVIMLSGKDAFFDKVKGHMAGATEYLTKPFETPAVLAAVNSRCQPAEVAHG